MFVVTKNGRTARLASDVQLAAYLHGGWELAGGDAPAAPAPEPSKVEAPKQNAWDEPGIDRGEWIERARALGIRNAHSMSEETLVRKVTEAESKTEV